MLEFKDVTDGGPSPGWWEWLFPPLREIVVHLTHVWAERWEADVTVTSMLRSHGVHGQARAVDIRTRDLPLDIAAKKELADEVNAWCCKEWGGWGHRWALFEWPGSSDHPNPEHLHIQMPPLWWWLGKEGKA